MSSDFLRQAEWDIVGGLPHYVLRGTFKAKAMVANERTPSVRSLAC